MNTKRYIAAALLSAFVASNASADTGLRLNQIQVIGSHNSYKQAIEAPLLRMIHARAPETARSLDYQHPSLTRQLTLGLRKLELDVFHDPKGGRYRSPAGVERMREAGYQPVAFDPKGEMDEPGFKVLHAQDIDYRSTCLTLDACLRELLDFSDANPRHLPIAVSFNAKDGRLSDPGYVEPLAFTATVFDALDRAILAAIPRQRILTPDDVRGGHDTLESAVLEAGWPRLDTVRGKFIFLLDHGGTKLDAYLEDHPSLAGRVMFANAPEGHPAAAFLVINDPIRAAARIDAAIRKGYLVRTRADANTIEARENDTQRRDAAFASGAHFVSTDYYDGIQGFDNDYRVVFPNGAMARCNVLNTPADCAVSP